MKHLIYVFIAASLMLASCEKNALTIPVDPVTSGARLKLINVAPDLPGGIELAVNGKKFSAFTPSGVTASSSGFAVGLPYNNSFPSSGSNYAIVSPGAVSLSLTSPATTTTASATAVGSSSATLDDNVYYSLFVSGTGVQPETTLLKDDFTQLNSSSKVYVRFVNMIPNGPATGYDLFILSADGKTATPVAQAIAYKGASSFVTLDAFTNPTLALRLPGATTNVGTVVFSNIANGRVLTVFARGLVGRTGATAASLNLYVNR
ncbi:DUF4397 domain-containing protein [Fibrella aquatilis]|uniref:DUF4397 domain-containing protein n=1 Tax=Fibrella aquatilis TaxID=2817059 RepID=A0A939GCL6_9BACT|nr:DUF4397 domain-containing protein [Fibrella aquatilis]MBO0934365.1 DUF4397 domain-containing protein [Fibrella aquatilis]